LATLPGTAGQPVGSPLAGIDQALGQIGIPPSGLTDDDDALEDGETAETTSAQDEFFTLLG
jgi:hypothetical protein